MNITKDVFLSLLAADAYNRGYNSGLSKLLNGSYAKINENLDFSC